MSEVVDESNCAPIYDALAQAYPKCMGGFNKSVFDFGGINVTMGAIMLAGAVYWKLKQDMKKG